MTTKSWVYIAFLSLIWGSSFYFINVSLRGFTPLTLVFLRVSISSIALFAWMRLMTSLTLPKCLKSWVLYAAISVIATALPFALISWGQLHISSSMASMLNASVPIFTLIFAHFLTQDEKITLPKLIGVLIGFSGIYTLLSPSLQDGFTLQGWGQISVIGASICYALAAIWSKKLAYNPPLVNSTCTLICAAFIMLPFMFVFEDPFSLSPGMSSIVAIITLAVFGSGIAYILLYKVIAMTGAVSLSMVTYLIPITASIIGVLALNETIAPTSLMGIGVIFIGLIFVDGRILRLIKKQLGRGIRK